MDLTAMLADEWLVDHLGPETVVRGKRYARDGHVDHLGLNEDRLELTAEVAGSRHRRYLVEVALDPDPPFDHVGRCTCPMAEDCKHVVAALVTLRQSLPRSPLQPRTPVSTPAPPTAGSARPGPAPEPAAAPGPGWESDLQALLGRADPERVGGEALGLRFEAVVSRGASVLQCRPVRRSSTSTRWVQTGAGWQDVTYDFRRQFMPGHVRLLKRLRHAAVDVAASSYYGGYAGSPWLPLDRAEENLWAILDQLVAAGVTLLGARDADRVVIAERALEVAVDVAAGQAGALQVRPVLREDDVEVPVGPFVLIGEPGHGLARVNVEGGRTVLELTHLARPVEPGLARWLAAGQPVTVPAQDRERFLHRFYPGLRREAAVVSSDASVELPDPVEPVVRLTVHHPAPEQLELDWAVGYGPPGTGTEFPLGDRHGREVRDLVAEQALWADLAPILAQAPAEALNPVEPGRPRVRGVLTGLAAAEFASERLVELEAAGVEVVHSGDRTDYRRAEGAPEVVVSTDERPDGSDWFDLTIAVSINDEPVPFVLLFRALAEGAGHLILPSGLYFSLAQPEFTQLAELIGEARALQDRERTSLRIHVQQAGLWDELTRLGVVGRQAARWQSRVAALARLTEPGEVASPAGLRADLRPYQLEGYAWLHRLWELGLGGVLADDMGLGKTLQVLALIARVREDQQRDLGSGSDPGPASAPFLVVAPTSVTATWLSEAARFTPGLRVVAVSQTEAKRAVSLAELAAGADVVITSYTLVRLDAEAYQALPWQALVLDEAQFAKNYQAKTYAALRHLDVGVTIAMTGTPLENSLMDLWAMLSLTAPGMFPSPERFSEYFRRPIERGTRPERLDRLRDRIRPVMLRRTKEQVATELPPKQEQVLTVDLHPRHAKIYARQLQRERQKVLGLIADLDTNRFTILRSLTLLRQLSLDAALVDPEHEGVPSAKVELLVEMMTALVAEGHRALVFSQFTTFLKRVGERLSEAGVDYAYLDGRTRNRARVIEGFKTGTSGAFLISLKAGGFGLNLTEADYCFVLDPWWNPASEAQAVDRAHRIGQDRPVMVYRLVSKNTIEDKVMELKSRKKQLFDSVMSADGLPAGAFTPAEIRSLLAG